MKRFKYYKWIFSYWMFSKFSGNHPNGHYPMKYNDETGEFDLFYTWKEIMAICEHLRKSQTKE